MTGTCLPNRKQFPRNLKVRMSLEVGQCLTQQTSDATVMAMRWKDRNDDFILSTVCSSVQAMSPARSANRAGKMKPTCVLMYNKYMGGADTNDQMESNYSLCRCTRKVWKKLVMHVLGLVITCAYIVKSMKHPNMFLHHRSRHIKFRLNLAEDLLAESLLNRAPFSGTLAMIQHSSKRLQHTPCHNEYIRKKSFCVDAPAAKMYCSVCKKNNNIYRCRACKLPFCIVNCFLIHHERFAWLANVATLSTSTSTTSAATERLSTLTVATAADNYHVNVGGCITRTTKTAPV